MQYVRISLVAPKQGHRDGVIAIPKCGDCTRLKENLGALAVRLSPGQLAELDAIFPPPSRARPLEML